MIRRPPRSTRTDTLFPCTTLFRSRALPELNLVVAHLRRHVVLRALGAVNDAKRLDMPLEIVRQIIVGRGGIAELGLSADTRKFYGAPQCGEIGRGSEERRVGKEWVSTGRCGWVPMNEKKKKK